MSALHSLSAKVDLKGKEWFEKIFKANLPEITEESESPSQSYDEKRNRIGFEENPNAPFFTYNELIMYKLQDGDIMYRSDYGHPDTTYKLPVMEITELSRLMCFRILQHIRFDVLPSPTSELETIINELMWYINLLKQVDPREKTLWKTVQLGTINMVVELDDHFPFEDLSFDLSDKLEIMHPPAWFDEEYEPILSHTMIQLMYSMLINNLKSIATRIRSPALRLIIRQSLVRFRTATQRVKEILESNDIHEDSCLVPVSMLINFQFDNRNTQQLQYNV